MSAGSPRRSGSAAPRCTGDSRSTASRRVRLEMSSGRTQLTLYLIAVHVPFALVAVLVLEADLVPRGVIFVLEAVFAVSLAVGLWLPEGRFAPPAPVPTGARLLRAGGAGQP